MKLRWSIDSYLQRVDLIPPVLCWLLARQDRMPIPLAVIAGKVGLSKRRMTDIFSLTTWAGITVKRMDTIRGACGINPGNESKHIQYLRESLATTSPFLHQQKRPPVMKLHMAGILNDPDFRKELERRYREFYSYSAVRPGRRGRGKPAVSPAGKSSGLVTGPASVSSPA